MLWGNTWGGPWGSSLGPGPAAFCQLADDRVLVQMSDVTGNRNFRDMMCVFAEGFGEVQDVTNDVLAGFDLTTAAGVQLDAIGSLIGLARDDFSDTRYRTFLSIQVDLLRPAASASANWTGTHNNTLTLCRTFIGTGVANPIVLTNLPPYNLSLSIPGVLPAEVPLLTRFVCKSLYAGVYGFVLFASDTKVFGSDHGAVANEGIFGSVHGAVANAALFGHVAPVVGGARCC